MSLLNDSLGTNVGIIKHLAKLKKAMSTMQVTCEFRDRLPFLLLLANLG